MSRRACLFIIVLALSCMMGASVMAAAQTAPAAKISGYVVSSDNRPVPNAAVFLYQDGNAAQVQQNPLMTDASGHYSFEVPGYGNYSVVASRNNFNYTSAFRVTGAVSGLNLTLPARISNLK